MLNIVLMLHFYSEIIIFCKFGIKLKFLIKNTKIAKGPKDYNYIYKKWPSLPILEQFSNIKKVIANKEGIETILI